MDNTTCIWTYLGQLNVMDAPAKEYRRGCDGMRRSFEDTGEPDLLNGHGCYYCSRCGGKIVMEETQP
jgi:hypothetical protein